jgi:hypothetical protein
LRTSSAEFQQLLINRYAGYVRDGLKAAFTFDVELIPPEIADADAEATVRLDNGQWVLERGDFRAVWDPKARRGRIRQSLNPYAIDSVLRIVHTMLLANDGGFLLHASSGVRGGKAYLFSGVSEAGKTTIARLAPSDVALLTDEVSYVRRDGEQYFAFGTPFAGELGKAGENISAPIEAVYLLSKAEENHIEPMAPAEALRRLMRNILFFANDAALVRQVFEAASAFVARIPVFELAFYPDARVWDLLG